MSEIKSIIENIDTDSLSEHLGDNYAEELELTDYNFQILKIDIDDLKIENYDNIETIGFAKHDDWETLKAFVGDKEVKAIQEELKEDIKYYNEDSDCDSSKIYKALMYCKNEYAWGSTYFCSDD